MTRKRSRRVQPAAPAPPAIQLSGVPPQVMAAACVVTMQALGALPDALTLGGEPEAIAAMLTGMGLLRQAVGRLALTVATDAGASPEEIAMLNALAAPSRPAPPRLILPGTEQAK